MKALFWDFDGTLIYPNQSSLCSLRDALIQCHHKISDEDISGALRASLSWYNWQVSYEDSTGDEWWDRLFHDLMPFYEEHGITDYEEVNVLFKENVTSFRWYSLFENIKAVLQQCLDKGYKNYIVSNNYPELPKAIEILELTPYFSNYVISSLVGYEKPRPEIFQYAIKLAGDPVECIMIGDNPIADIQGARSVGMRTVYIHSSDKEPCLYADFNCSDPSDIISYIR